MISPGTAGRVGIARAVEDGQQRSSQSQRRSDQKKTRKCWTERRRNEVQELGGNAKLHESGQERRATQREGDMHEEGEPDTRRLEKVDGSMVKWRG